MVGEVVFVAVSVLVGASADSFGVPRMRTGDAIGLLRGLASGFEGRRGERKLDGGRHRTAFAHLVISLLSFWLFHACNKSSTKPILSLLGSDTRAYSSSRRRTYTCMSSLRSTFSAHALPSLAIFSAAASWPGAPLP